MNISNFLKSYYSIVFGKKNSRVQQMHYYNIESAKQNKDVEELKEMYTDIIHINSFTIH